MIDFNIVILGNENFDNYDYFKRNMDRVFSKMKIRKDNKIINPKLYIGSIEYNIDKYTKRYAEENEYSIEVVDVNTRLYGDRSEEILKGKLVRALMSSTYSRGLLIHLYDGKNKRNVEIYQRAMEYSIKIELINIGSVFV